MYPVLPICFLKSKFLSFTPLPVSNTQHLWSSWCVCVCVCVSHVWGRLCGICICVWLMSFNMMSPVTSIIQWDLTKQVNNHEVNRFKGSFYLAFTRNPFRCLRMEIKWANLVCDLASQHRLHVWPFCSSYQHLTSQSRETLPHSSSDLGSTWSYGVYYSACPLPGPGLELGRC